MRSFTHACHAVTLISTQTPCTQSNIYSTAILPSSEGAFSYTCPLHGFGCAAHVPHPALSAQLFAVLQATQDLHCSFKCRLLTAAVPIPASTSRKETGQAQGLLILLSIHSHSVTYFDEDSLMSWNHHSLLVGNMTACPKPSPCCTTCYLVA